jgi:hypothetical protein
MTYSLFIGPTIQEIETSHFIKDVECCSFSSWLANRILDATQLYKNEVLTLSKGTLKGRSKIFS